MRNKLIALSLVLGAVMGSLYSQNNLKDPAQVKIRLSHLNVSKTHIVDDKGKPVVLRGMSLSWSQWHGKYYTPNVVKILKEQWKSTVIRAAMGVEHGGYLKNPEKELSKIKTVIEAAIQEGLYVIVDWHDHRAEHHKEEAGEFFEQIARKYGAYPNLIYEIYNEPIKAKWEKDLKPYHKYIIDRIRKQDPDNIIVLGTPYYSQDVDIAAQDPVEGTNLAYTLHFYAGTHGEELREKAQKAIDKGLPLFVTEYGTTRANGDDGVYEKETRLWWEFLERNKISYCNWSICDKAEDSAAFKPSRKFNRKPNTEKLTTSGAFVNKHLRSGVFH